MAFMAYRRHADGIRLFLDGNEANNGEIDWNFPVDVIFNEPGGVRFEGVTDIAALKRLSSLMVEFEKACARETEPDLAFQSMEYFATFLEARTDSRELPPEPWRAAVRRQRAGRR